MVQQRFQAAATRLAANPSLKHSNHPAQRRAQSPEGFATLATAPPEQNLTSDGGRSAGPVSSVGTSHLKVVPERREIRKGIRERAAAVAAQLEAAAPLGQARLEALGRELLSELDLPEAYLGWTMVAILSAFWREPLSAVPPAQRLLLLPAADTHRSGSDSLDELRSLAEAAGCQTMVVDSAASMMRRILAGDVNGVIGLAPLDLLERAIDRMLLAGVPCAAAPLVLVDGAVQDADWIRELIQLPYRPGARPAKGYVHLMRTASRMFEPEHLARLAPRTHSVARENGHLDPLSATESLAYEFLAKGGKHSRPFITLAVHDALANGRSVNGDQAQPAPLSDAILRAALSIETFHKASLVHDDIEDDDEFRYGDQTLHRKYGTPTAINVGDYLIGLGYRLVSRETPALGPEVTADILDCLAQAHMKLSEGQGAELIWRDSHHKAITPADALQIYALKTAPAFEAALWTGLRLAGPIQGYADSIPSFARHLGVAFQVLNDLKDWTGDSNNKLTSLGDIVGGRPTVLWALALENLPADDRQRLLSLVATPELTLEQLGEIRALYTQAGVFDKALELVAQHQCLAQEVANEIQPRELSELLAYLIEMVLDRQPIALSARPGIVNR